MQTRVGDTADEGFARLLGLHEIGVRCVRDGRIDELLVDSLDAAVDVTRAHFGAVHVVDAATGELDLAAHHGMAPDLVRLCERGGDGQAVCRAALDRRRQIVVEDIRASTRYSKGARQALLHANAAACQATPLVTRDGDPIGVYSTYFRAIGRPGRRELQLVEMLARHAADFIEHARERAAAAQRCAREREAREAAEASVRTTGRFLLTVSHELRQPLTAALAAVEVQKLAVAPEGRTRTVVLIGRQLRQIARLVDDLADLAHLGRGALDLRRQRLDLRDVIQHAIDTTAPLFEARRHRSTVDLGAAPAWTFGDAERMTQVFSNLLQNAAAYTPPGGDITVALTTDGGSLVATIEDTGIGIPTEALGRIFEPFERASADGSRTSLGIGLAVVRPIVELHGGSVSAYSDGPGTGSRFVVTLPAAA